MRADEDRVINNLTQRPLTPEVKQKKMNMGIDHFNRLVMVIEVTMVIEITMVIEVTMGIEITMVIEVAMVIEVTVVIEIAMVMGD